MDLRARQKTENAIQCERLLNSAISEEKEIASCPNQAIRMSQGDWPKPVLPQGMACLRVPSPCGA